MYTNKHYHVTGFPIDSRDQGENEIVLTLFTLERGKIRVVVKGTKKKNSSLRAGTIPFNENHYFIAMRRSLDLLLEWELLESFPGIGDDLGKFAMAGYFHRFILSIVPGREHDINLYFLIENIYLLLQSRLNNDIIKVLFEWSFMRIMGIAPSFGVCSSCGEAVGRSPVYWKIEDGVCLCQECNVASGDRVLRLQPDAVMYGKEVAEKSTVLTETSRVEEPEKLVSFMDPLSRHSEYARKAFHAAVVRFCQFHLKEEIAYWKINI